jgi:hypothetical protein
MSSRRIGTLAWSLGGLAVLFTGAELFLLALNWDTPKPGDFGARWVEIVDSVLLLMFPLMGSLIASKRPTNPIGWLLTGASLVVVTEEFAREYGLYGLATDPGAVPGAAFASWWFQVTWIVSLAALPVLFLLFPNGRLLSRRWRWTIVASFIPVAIVMGPVAFKVWPYRGRDLLVEPDSLSAVRDAEALIGPALLILLGMFVVALISMWMRYRRTHVVEKQQIRWLLFTGLFLIVVDVLIDLLISGPPSALEELVGTISISLVPVAIAVAILRHRLYDIDRIINRAIVYAVVTGSLVAVYAGTVFALGTMAVGKDDNLTVAAATLVAAAAFRPLLRRVQGFVDRRFYRHKYDAQKTIDAFGARLREETDLDELTADLVGVVKVTMQPANVGLWLTPAEDRL